MRHTSNIDNVLAIDFETANRTRVSACSVGLCDFDFATGALISAQHQLINPHTDFDYGNMMVNGITPELVEDAPDFAETLPLITQHIRPGTVVVAHNAPFDMSVLRRSCEYYGLDLPPISFYCTLKLARTLMPGLPSYRLPDVAAACGIDAFRHHRADDDAEACGRIYLYLAKLCGAHSLDDIAKSTGIKRGLCDGDYYHACCSISAPCADIVQPCTVALAMDDPPDNEHKVSQCRNSPLRNKTVVITGALPMLSRSEAEQLIEEAGGSVGHTVTKATHYVVSGAQDLKVLKGYAKSSKLRRAEELIAEGKRIKIITGEELLAMLGIAL